MTPVRRRRAPSPAGCVCRFWRSGEKANMAATVVKGGEAGSPSRAGERRAILVRSRRAVMKKAPRRVPGGAVRDCSAALLGTSSHARNPATDNNNSAEGAAKEEDALVLHGQFSICRPERASRVRTPSTGRRNTVQQRLLSSLERRRSSAGQDASLDRRERTHCPLPRYGPTRLPDPRKGSSLDPVCCSFDVPPTT